MSSPQSGTRRDFVTASAAAGVVAAANVGAYAAGNDTIRVGLIGAGGRGTGAVRNILDAERTINGANGKVEIVAVGDVFKERAEGAVRTFKNGRDYAQYAAQVKVTPETTFDGLDAYQRVLGANVDLVILATPPGFRPLHLEAAIRAGKNIFCEKPVCVDAAGARKVYGLVEESRRKNLAIVAGTQRRHQKGYIETIKRIHDGAIGDVVSARVAWNSGGSPPIWFNARRPGETDAAYQLRNWYHFQWVCGDHIVEQHVHNLDVANWVLKGRPVRATGIGGRSSRPGGANADPKEFGNIWDHFAVEYEYANGVRVFSYCRHIAGSESDVSETVFGSRGVSRVNNYTINRDEVGSDDRDAYVQEHIDLLNSIRAGRPLNELQAVTDSTFTAILGRNASFANRWLTWDNALNADEDTMPKGLTLQATVPVPAAPVPGAWRLPPRGKA
ncbi:Gfo/Idh/MocA family protein [Urbifossiella limnaea]|uniref:Inositol 2-dehydrogenase n=1 Tax=Urbifossiella limnaea TaxID=2528023 RepID=A0A517XSM4_9BACT|nr:Gfo/Idh/MocA family oxidoreductase [Urbifossiella limnaea]QDU20501.1 Inositol 2-dehydrogenase [Urbifossiella limnaea]